MQGNSKKRVRDVVFRKKSKEELAGQFSPARHCQVAEMAALLCGCGHVEKMSDGNIKLWIQTENEAVARKKALHY